MSRAHSSFIPAEQVEKATDWNFTAVDQAALRFAAKLKAQALEEERSRNDTERKAGYNEGYAAGFAQGHAQATLEGQKQIDDYIAHEGKEAADRMAQIFADAQAQLVATEPTIARGVLELACELARQVVRSELKLNPKVLEPVIHEALSLLTGDSKPAVVRLHPQDMERLDDGLQRAFPNLGIAIQPDPQLTPGGCLVESAGSVVDATVQRRWTRAVAALGLDTPWEPPLSLAETETETETQTTAETTVAAPETDDGPE